VLKVVVGEHVLRVSTTVPSTTSPRSMMYATAGKLVTAADVPQPRVDENHDVDPTRVVFTVTLELHPVEMLAPRVGATGHKVHTADVVAPTTDENVPVEHEPVHAGEARPDVAPQVPAEHSVQAAVEAPPVEYEPGLQVPEQAAVSMPVDRPYVPAGHGVHAAVVALPVE
jgi:hypothetical protein